MVFNSSAALNKYITSPSYGTRSAPELAAAVELRDVDAARAIYRSATCKQARSHNRARAHALSCLAWPGPLARESDKPRCVLHRYALRLNHTQIPAPELQVSSGDAEWQAYRALFAPLQMLVDRFATLRFLRADNDTLSEAPQRILSFPRPASEHSDFQARLKHVMGGVLVAAFIYPFTAMLRDVIEAKQSHVRDLLAIMGLSDDVFWVPRLAEPDSHASLQSWHALLAPRGCLAGYDTTQLRASRADSPDPAQVSWLTVYAAELVAVSAGLTIMLSPSVFSHADGSLLFFLFLAFSFALLAFNTFLCAFFSSAKLGVSVGSFVFVLSYFPYLAAVGAAEGVRRLAAALPPVAFALGVENIREHEEVRAVHQPARPPAGRPR